MIADVSQITDDSQSLALTIDHDLKSVHDHRTLPDNKSS